MTADETALDGVTLHYESDGTIAVRYLGRLVGGMWPSLDVPGWWCAQRCDGTPLLVVKDRPVALGHLTGDVNDTTTPTGEKARKQ